MASTTFDKFELGLDRRRDRRVADANRMVVLDNAFVTNGRALRKRPGLQLFAQLEAGTAGLISALGKLNTFYSQGTITHSNTAFQANKVAHPTDIPDVNKVPYGTVYQGFIYAIVEYDNGTRFHHYLDSTSPTHIVDANCPHTRSVAKVAEKLFAIDGDTVAFCATGVARDWTTADDAGFLPTGNRAEGDSNAQIVAPFQKYLGVWMIDGIQLWAVDPDPQNHAFFQQAYSVGSRYPRAIARLATDTTFLTDVGVRSISISVFEQNMEDSDIGSPIDTLVRPEIAGSDPFSFYSQRFGQIWYVFTDHAWVYTYGKHSKITAWSRYAFPFEIEAAAELGGELYVRNGDNVYKLVDTQYTDDGEDISVLIELPYLDMGKPGIDKQFQAADFVGTGTYQVQWRHDPRDFTKITAPVDVVGDTYQGPLVPIECGGVKIAPVITHAANEAFQLDELTVWWEPNK